MAKVNLIQLQKHLKGMEYPSSKDDLIAHAQQHGSVVDSFAKIILIKTTLNQNDL